MISNKFKDVRVISKAAIKREHVKRVSLAERKQTRRHLSAKIHILFYSTMLFKEKYHKRENFH
jgi:hypothetical protein